MTTVLEHLIGEDLSDAQREAIYQYGRPRARLSFLQTTDGVPSPVSRQSSVGEYVSTYRVAREVLLIANECSQKSRNRAYDVAFTAVNIGRAKILSCPTGLQYPVNLLGVGLDRNGFSDMVETDPRYGEDLSYAALDLEVNTPEKYECVILGSLCSSLPSDAALLRLLVRVHKILTPGGHLIMRRITARARNSGQLMGAVDLRAALRSLGFDPATPTGDSSLIEVGTEVHSKREE